MPCCLTLGERQHAHRGKTDRLDAEAVARVVVRDGMHLPVVILEGKQLGGAQRGVAHADVHSADARCFTPQIVPLAHQEFKHGNFIPLSFSWALASMSTM